MLLYRMKISHASYVTSGNNVAQHTCMQWYQEIILCINADPTQKAHMSDACDLWTWKATLEDKVRLHVLKGSQCK